MNRSFLLFKVNQHSWQFLTSYMKADHNSKAEKSVTNKVNFYAEVSLKKKQVQNQ